MEEIRPNCPNCDRPLTKIGFNQSGTRRWACVITQKPKTYCFKSSRPYLPKEDRVLPEDHPNCPNCNKKMAKSGHHKDGRQKWECKKQFGKGASSVIIWCSSMFSSKERMEDEQKNKKPLLFKRDLKAASSSRYLITSAQNATPVHDAFWKSLTVAAKHLKAEIIVIPIRYKNPTSKWTGSQDNEEYWAQEVTPYLCNERKKIGPNIVLLGDVKTQPTATSPLSGLEGFTGTESAIAGHTKLQLKVIAVPAGKTPKILTTTGACTVPNYTDSKTGKLGNFHHTLGAALVETKGRKFFLRQINATKDGTFIDKDKLYTPSGVKAAGRALAVSLGDVHVEVTDPVVTKATFGKDGIVEVLKPEHIFYNDVHDGLACNPHDQKDVFIQIAKAGSGRNNVRAEVERTCKFVEEYTPKDTKAVIVTSNHDDFLRRWVVNSDWREDPTPENAEFYLETALEMVRGTKMLPNGASYPSPFPQWAKKLIKNIDLKVLETDESFVLSGVEFGLHGDRGPNGSRGSAANLSKLGTKTVIGHSHTPRIENGCYQAGTSSYIRLGYNSGPSSWLASHVVQYANGKRCIITIVDGEWKL